MWALEPQILGWESPFFLFPLGPNCSCATQEFVPKDLVRIKWNTHHHHHGPNCLAISSAACCVCYQMCVNNTFLPPQEKHNKMVVFVGWHGWILLIPYFNLTFDFSWTFFFGAMPHSRRDLSSLIRDWICAPAPALEVQSLTHWTAREVSEVQLFHNYKKHVHRLHFKSNSLHYAT